MCIYVHARAYTHTYTWTHKEKILKQPQNIPHEYFEKSRVVVMSQKFSDKLVTNKKLLY